MYDRHGAHLTSSFVCSHAQAVEQVPPRWYWIGAAHLLRQGDALVVKAPGQCLGHLTRPYEANTTLKRHDCPLWMCNNVLPMNAA